MGRYSYSRRPARPNVWNQFDIPGHQMGMAVRRDKLGEEDLHYNTTCTCGWKDTLPLESLGPKTSNTRWARPKKDCNRVFQAHIRAVRGQGSLLGREERGAGSLEVVLALFFMAAITFLILIAVIVRTAGGFIILAALAYGGYRLWDRHKKGKPGKALVWRNGRWQ